MDSYPYHHQQNQPPPPASYYNHAPPPPPPQQPYNYPYPPQPYNYQPPPPHSQQYAPPPPPLHHSQYPPPPRPHFPSPHPPPPGAPTVYSHPPPPDQWGNASWPQHPGWEYSERNAPYNNKEDWASKAKEWATTNVGTEMLHAHSNFAPADDNRYTYHNQFQPPNQQLNNQQLHAVDPLDQATYTHGAGSYTSGYNAGDGTIKAKANDVAPQKNYGSTSSVYEQEVSYSYSSTPGNQNSMHQTQSSHVPMPAHFPVVQESYHSQSLPPPVVAGQQPHFSNHGPTSFIPDACDRPLDFVHTHKPQHEPCQNVDYAPMTSSIHTWTTQIPSGPAAPFDPTYVPQVPIPMHAPNFQSSLPPVSVASSYAFNADPSANINFSERPKKATVPNWLREEIIKNKPVIPSTTSTLPAGNSINSVGLEGDNSIRRVDQGDSKSIDSTKSTEDEDDEEEDVEAAKTAALNQEIKRVLTEILLKVTDELFDEIAAKVLDEEEEKTIAGEDSSTNGNHKASVPTTTTEKASAKVLIPYKTESSHADNGEENTSSSSPGGNLLGLGTYASDDEDEIQSSKVVSSENKESAYHHQESKHDNKQVEDGTDNGSAVRKANNVAKTIISSVESLNHIEKAPVATKSIIDGNRRISDELFTNDYQDKELKNDDISINNSLKSGGKKSSTEKISHENSVASDYVTQVDKNRPKDKSDKDKLKKKEDDKKSERRSNMKELDFGSSSKHGSSKDDREDRIKDKRDKHEDGEKKRERVKDEKEDQSKRVKASAKYNHRRSLSPSSRGKNSKDKSFSRNSASGDEPSDNSRKRSKQSHNSSLSPSPTRSRKRQNSRSPHSRHSHRRHSPYSSTERRRR